MRQFFILLLFFTSFIPLLAQDRHVTIRGRVVDASQSPIPDVSVFVERANVGAVSDANGDFQLLIKQESAEQYLVFRHVQFEERKVKIDSVVSRGTITIVLEASLRMLDQVNVTDSKISELNTNASSFRLNPLQAQFNPAPFQDISALLTTLPGVSTNNELSSGYAVRGGNYDENLVYVNSIPVYRPQIVTAGQQEGLSFVNVDLTGSIDFSSGGWESKYGDGLASMLNINYKKPVKFAGSLNLGLLGGSAHLEGITRNGRMSYLLGLRHKSSVYLLNTLETKGEYRPKFTDIQGYINYDISKKGEKGQTELGVLFSYAQNRYQVQPSSRESTFGTFNNQLRLFVAFDGRDRLTYDVWQGGVRLSHRFSSRWRSHFVLSGTKSREREYYDIESGYLLCNVDNDVNSELFNECQTNIGIGTNYYSGRNLLDVSLINAESRNEVIIDQKNTMEFGFGYAYHEFKDNLNEYEFVDSADYISITNTIKTSADLEYSRIHAYWQNTTNFNSHHKLTYGFRMLFQTFSDDLLVSPRVQYTWNPVQLRNTFFRASAGLYRQAPFYREYRNDQGELNEKLKGQSSVHSIIGMDVNFTKWGRPFKFTTEIYGKYLWNVNPYDLENVRIRYFGENNATAYAAGVDFRVSGEFIPGDESWFSLGLLTTKEDLENDNRGYIPRPSDQRVNLAIFFQDHIPNYPTFRVHLRLLYSTGLPFSPPDNLEYRNYFRGGDYQRFDIGFSKMITFGSANSSTFFKSLWLSAEILNLTGHQNAISYYWVKDVYSNNYAVPNSLSQRFFNLRANLKF
jgi:hypothetical protein